MTPETRPGSSLSGDEVWRMCGVAATWLARNAATIDAINVFPVPDGDTGANMSATFNAAVDAARGVQGGAGVICQALARGALLGARGNSGVILSQMMRGFATGIGASGQLDAPRLVVALQAATESAYHAVPNPIEGTMLSVLRDVATGVAAVAQPEMPLNDAFAVAFESAQASVERTPELLPILREAGVVDSGGLGLSVILEGCLCFLRGESLPENVPTPQTPTRDVLRTLSRDEHDGFGYCTEFLIAGSELNLETLKAQVCALGTSVLVVGETTLAHVHVHTSDPGAALSLGVRFGALQRVKVENMDAQHQTLVQRSSPSAAANIAVVAVAIGEGFERILADYGASVVRGGQTMNPSAEELVRAVSASPGATAIMLPNNRNVTLTAQQAAALAEKPVRIVPTRSVPEGIAALLAFRPDAGIEENATTMNDAAAAIRTIEITRAARQTTVGGAAVAEGQAIGLIDGSLAVSGSTPNETARAAIEQALTPTSSAITIYYGREPSSEDVEALRLTLEQEQPGLEIQAVWGGQPYYEYIIAVE